MRRAVGWLLRLPLRLVPESAVVRVPRGPLRGMRWLVRSAPHGAWLGTLERGTLDDFAAHAAPGMTVWDVGANVGLYTLAASRLVGAAGHVVAFEPAPENVALLREHLSLNGLTNVAVVEAAVGGSEAVVRLAAGDSRSEFHVSPDGDLSVAQVSLDAWVSQDGRVPSVIKIDVEGAEEAVLAGAAAVLRDHRPRLYLAVHSEDIARRCHARLREAGYDVATVGGGSPFTSSEWVAVPGRRTS